MRGSRRTQSEGVLAGSFLHISQWKPIRTKTWMLPRYAPQPTGKLPILSDAVHQCSLFMHILDLCCALPSHFCARSGGRKHLICLQIGAGLVVRRSKSKPVITKPRRGRPQRPIEYIKIPKHWFIRRDQARGIDHATRYAACKLLCARVVAQNRVEHASRAQFEPMQAHTIHMAAYLRRGASFRGGRASAAAAGRSDRSRLLERHTGAGGRVGDGDRAFSTPCQDHLRV
jgi:hypothetical protein